MALTIILAVLGSTGLATLIQFFVNRHDTRVGTIDKIASDLQSLREEMRRDRAVLARIRILAASDEIRHGKQHSKEWWDQVNDDITGYGRYCDKHPDFKNNRAVQAIENLDRVYAERLQKNDFI